MSLRSWAAAAAVGWFACGTAAFAQSDAVGSMPPNVLSDAETKAGWTLLFDGKSFDGWRNYKKDGISDGWKIEDGAMVRAGNGAGDIVTNEEYDNFELLLEYRISEGGNSGLMFLVTEDNPVPWHSGPEVQIQDNAAGHDPQKAGWLYQLYEPFKPGWVKQVGNTAKADEQGRLDATRPAGEWNQLYLRITEQQCAVIMNGYPYYQFVVGDEKWKERVANSKFAKFDGFAKADKGHICLQDHGNQVAFRNVKLRKIAANGTAPNPVDGQVAVKPVLAFPDLEFTGWTPDENGKIRELRPIIMTSARDGSNRMFVGTQRGVVHVFDNKPDVKATKVFLDIKEKVAPFTGAGANEEGFLGLAFHPNYKENGRFFVYYTERPGLKSVISEFRVSKDDPNKADPASEKVLLTIEQPFKNHNGGPIEFGPDGHLYIGLGDGGSAYDPYGNGQNLGSLLGKILRIDVDHHTEGKSYGIPKDNPFVGKEGASPEIFAYGFRNPWRIGFDRKTGNFWVADVGQDLWEEVNIVTNGGNYGWSGRESFHPFGDWKTNGSDPIPPVWEYDHQVGKSITGGTVYRGKSAPELDGHYIYADYVSQKLWALKVDDQTGKAMGNFEIPGSGAVLAFGEDEAGEMYYAVGTPTGKGIFKFASTGQKTASK